MSKKIYSLLLVVVMLFTFSSASVFASDPYSFVISNFSTANTSTTVNRAVIAVNNTDLISYYKTFSVTRT